MKHILPLLLLVFSIIPINAQTDKFPAFLSNFNEIIELDDSVFVPSRRKQEDFNSRYTDFLPVQDRCFGCKEKVNWWGCRYLRKDNHIVAFLQYFCADYDDRFNHWLMEDCGIDDVIVVYSLDGRIQDFKIMARNSEPCYLAKMHYDARHDAFIIEQSVLDEPSFLHRFDDYVYTVTTHRYSITKNGKIKDKVLRKQGKHIVPNKYRSYSDVQLTFPQFLSRFHKWDRPYVNDSIFKEDVKQELPAYFMYKLIPDSVDCQCWPTEMWWNAYHYIETSDRYLCFVNEGCSMPTAEEGIFTNYYMLVFAKQGILEQVVKICRSRDEDDFTPEEFNALLTKRLREVLMQME